jgi:putative Mg2+ transporter-C (MgtC) family protein
MMLVDVALRLGVALALGAIIGFERQWRQRIAGLRTNALVALGAAGFTVFALNMFGQSSGAPVVAQIVSGIGFLGAGVILREGLTVRGLNTAATLWCSAMVGTFAGGGALIVASIAAAIVVLTHLLLRPLVRFIERQPLSTTEIETRYTVEVQCRAAEEAHVRAVLLQAATAAALRLQRLNSANLDDNRVAVGAELVSPGRNDAALEQIVGRLSLEPYVNAARWQADQALGEG